MTASRVEVRRGTYHDSVTLMQVSRQAEELPGVEAAAAVAATPVNLELLARQGFAVDPAGLGPSDLVLCVRAADDDAAGQAMEQVEALLAGAGRGGTGGGSGAGPGAAPPRSLRAAARRDPDLNLAVLSVPGRHLGYEIAEALQAGLHVFCFSDGLDPATEAACKRVAAERGLLLMGPDCGTAIIDGVGLGFANAVRRGPVGVVGASGTGIQEVTCLLDAAGVGISHAIGVGGRDLSPEVGGIMTLRALDLLAADDATERLVVISKPPDPRVARRVADAAAATGKPAVLAFPGLGDPPPLPPGVTFAGSLEAAAAWAAGGRDSRVGRPRRWLSTGARSRPSTPGAIRGLFSGGTLCYEAMAVVAGVVGRVASNIPLRPEWRLADPHRSDGHTFVDFGDDAMTEGRAHPMIDPGLRNERFRREAADPETGVVLLDVVLGYGAHPDPAGELAPLIERALADRPGGLSVVVSLCGAAGDPQGLDGQAATLRAAGALVTRSSAQAARLALAAAGLGAPIPPGGPGGHRGGRP